MSALEMSSILTCPKCSHVESVDMSAENQLRFHACKGCGLVLMPKPGSCCIFCSYGSTPCPSTQKSGVRVDDSQVFTLSLTKRMRIPI